MVAPLDRSQVPFEHLQALVDHVWAGEGLRFPPKVRQLPRQARATVARGSRLVIEAPAQLATWVLLHELAHAMTSDADGRSDGHGPLFLGIYVRLLTRYARLDADMLTRSLAQAAIPWARDAKPVFAEVAASPARA